MDVVGLDVVGWDVVGSDVVGLDVQKVACIRRRLLWRRCRALVFILCDAVLCTSRAARAAADASTRKCTSG